MLALAARSSAADWPTYGGDNCRSGVTGEQLALPLEQVWVHRDRAPRPAWPAPARADVFHRKHNLTPPVTFDRALHVAVADGAVYFGSSADDKVARLDAATGSVRWTFFTEGPVRLAPSVADRKVYVGSDDGRVYCLGAADGKPLWTYCPGGEDARIPGNGRMISRWPVRCGVVVDGKAVYAAAGLFPSYGVFLCAIDAGDGTQRWRRKLDGISPQGYMLASDTRLYVPSGRNSPFMFDRRDGRPLGNFGGRGGSYALLSGDAFVFREEREDQLGLSDSRTRERLVGFSGLHLLLRGEVAYLHSADRLAALRRTEYLRLARRHNEAAARKDKAGEQKARQAMNACWGWKQPCAYPYAIILAGDVLFAGGENGVAAFSAADGKILWKGEVTGKAYGLAVAGKRLFVSTDRGTIHCFQHDNKGARGEGTEAGAAKTLPAGPSSLVPTLLHAAEQPQPAQLWVTVGPQIRHVAPDRVIVRLESSRPAALVLEYGAKGVPTKQIEANSSNRAYAVALEDLKPGQDYRLKVKTRDNKDGQRELASCGFDTSCDLRPFSAAEVPSPFPNDELAAVCAEAARQIVGLSGVDQGYALVLGCGRGRLMLELARRTRLQVIGIEDDKSAADAARRALEGAGIYGVRAVVHYGPLDKLPYTGDCFNLIVSARTLRTGELPPSAAEICRVLRPCGGVAWIGRPKDAEKLGGKLTRGAVEDWVKSAAVSGWKIEQGGGLRAVLRRGKPDGAGQWTHAYADPGNSACSEDELRSPIDIQWFGRPGPRQIVDRHNRPMAPLVKDGRMFVIGDNRIKAVDAYNGTPLWDWTIPNSRRTNISRDCGQAAVTDDLLYVVAQDKCLALDVATGRWMHTFPVPQLDPEKPRHWGYLACVDNLLLGSGCKPGASFGQVSEHSWKPGYLDNQPMVVSDRLFCLDRHSGRVLWTYNNPRSAAILNTAIAAGGGRVYFLESRNRPGVAENSGRVRLEVLLAKQTSHLAAIDLRSGKVAWQRPIDLSMLRHAAYLGYARNTLLITGSFNQGGHPRYNLWALHAGDGTGKWSAHYVRGDKKAGGSHGEQEQHPVIAGRVIYSRPAAFDLEKGTKLPFNLNRAGGGCGAISGSASFLFGRGSNPRMYPIRDAGASSVALTTVTRPGCWINIVAAGGLLLIPEGSSGCECAYPVQTSIAFTPRPSR